MPRARVRVEERACSSRQSVVARLTFRLMDNVFQPGTLLRNDRYEILEVLGTPQDKKVYLARDLVDGPIRYSRARYLFPNNFVMPSGITVRAWEVQVLARLGDHPNIATVLDHWEDDNIAAMVTRYLAGGRLADRIEESKNESGIGLPIEDVFRLSIELAYGLAYIHSCGILYLDLQPRNVLFDEWGTLHLVDFDTAIQVGDRHMSHMAQQSVINYMRLSLQRHSRRRAIRPLFARRNHLRDGLRFPGFCGKPRRCPDRPSRPTAVSEP